MSVESVKQLLREIQADSPLLRVPDRHYKAAYSRTVWALVEHVNEENDRLQRLTGQMEQLLRLVSHNGRQVGQLGLPARPRKDPARATSKNGKKAA